MKYTRNQEVEIKMHDGSWAAGKVRNAEPVNKRLLVRVNGTDYGPLLENIRPVKVADEDAPPVEAKPKAMSKKG